MENIKHRIDGTECDAWDVLDCNGHQIDVFCWSNPVCKEYAVKVIKETYPDAANIVSWREQREQQ